jgi:ribosomal protein S18 acetylase RimI-like enzyme
VNADVSIDSNRASVAAIRSHLADCDAGFVPRLSSRVDLDAYARKIADHAERIEAWSSGRLIGLIAVYCNDAASGHAYVTSMSVLPSHQGLGIASGLLQRCLEHVRQCGFQCVDLELDARNLAAGRLYRRHGFAPVRTDGTSEILQLTF